MTHERQFDRAQAPVPIQFRVLGGSGGAWLDGLMLDLSAGGMQFTTPHPVPQGALIEFRIQPLGRLQPCVVTGQVLRVDASKPEHTTYGAFFTHMNDQQQQMLEELVQFLKRGRNQT